MCQFQALLGAIDMFMQGSLMLLSDKSEVLGYKNTFSL